MTSEPTIFGTTAKWRLHTQLPIPLTTTANLGLDTSFDGKTELTGIGDSNQNNELKGTITVMVTKIFANGNLYVRGEKWISLNEGDEYVRVKGIIRPQDVNPDNTIESNRIADARITYSGKGAFADASKPGWLTRILTSPWWPL
jgi:flagellar L-ring protein precursor FlgH